MLYNTTHESGQTLIDFNFKNRNLDNAVRLIFEKFPDKSFTPYQVCDELDKIGVKMLPSSVKRSVTDLTDAGVLINTGIKIKERFGRPNYKWQLTHIQNGNGKVEGKNLSREEHKNLGAVMEEYRKNNRLNP